MFMGKRRQLVLKNYHHEIFVNANLVFFGLESSCIKPPFVPKNRIERESPKT